MELIVKVLQYNDGDLHFDYDDGSFEWFDSTKLKILKPESLKNKIFYIFHSESKEESNIWRVMGKKIKLEISEDIGLLPESLFKGHLFDGCILSIVEIKD